MVNSSSLLRRSAYEREREKERERGRDLGNANVDEGKCTMGIVVVALGYDSGQEKMRRGGVWVTASVRVCVRVLRKDKGQGHKINLVKKDDGL